MTKTQQIKNFLAENNGQAFTAEQIGIEIGLENAAMWLTRLRQRKEVEVHGKGKNSGGKGVHCYRAIHAVRASGILGITTHYLDGGVDRVTF